MEYLANLIHHASGGKWNNTLQNVYNMLEMKDEVIECLTSRLVYSRTFNWMGDQEIAFTTYPPIQRRVSEAPIKRKSNGDGEGAPPAKKIKLSDDDDDASFRTRGKIRRNVPRAWERGNTKTMDQPSPVICVLLADEKNAETDTEDDES